MKVIIAGSRDIKDSDLVFSFINSLVKEGKLIITEVISGKAKGVDAIGESYAATNNIPIKKFPANWKDLTEEPLFVKVDSGGRRYNALAGHNRNRRMAEYADAAIVIHKGSSGSLNMIEAIKEKKKPVFELKI